VRLVEGLLSLRALDPEQPEVVIRGRIRKHSRNWLVSLFLENGQREPNHKRHAPAWIFQVGLSAAGRDGQAVFVPRAEHRNGTGQDTAEAQRLAMAYRFHPGFAVGSGAAVHAERAADKLADLELDMKVLAELAQTSADALATALRPLITGYRG
jgi:hypothetical protein